ncbi:nucleoside/nucleotide kinase family protein [Catenuloplanes indicus]|uniref:Pantothenate kinase n=1 Tax=Catenuloplanes indicus TaxID=137267 RepID=A0AAE3W577_9ACTN|nr:nucleoside/nucleotide kinase family protein [Catenuloplanes indicus]MDQ0368575.1 pantothenate kinase [Catenuloplanes indicus]
MLEPMQWGDLLDRATRLASGGTRRILGIAGPPGAGKSTVAARLGAALTEAGAAVTVVPMDGFHLADAELHRLGRHARKGAPDTFDGAGFVALLHRLRSETGGVVYAPEFRREIEEPVAGAIPVPPETRLVITEGNYLLVPDGVWAGVRGLLDEAWYLDLDEPERLRRLIARHIAFGRDEARARSHALGSDQTNAELIATTKGRADLIVPLT